MNVDHVLFSQPQPRSSVSYIKIKEVLKALVWCILELRKAR
jgi:hypothetical protein